MIPRSVASARWGTPFLAATGEGFAVEGSGADGVLQTVLQSGPGGRVERCGKRASGQGHHPSGGVEPNPPGPTVLRTDARNYQRALDQLNQEAGFAA